MDKEAIKIINNLWDRIGQEREKIADSYEPLDNGKYIAYTKVRSLLLQLLNGEEIIDKDK